MLAELVQGGERFDQLRSLLPLHALNAAADIDRRGTNGTNHRGDIRR